MIYLGGGGSEHDESLVWDLVFSTNDKRVQNESQNKRLKIAVWPYAQPPSKHDAVFSWFASALEPRGGDANFIILREESFTPPYFGLVSDLSMSSSTCTCHGDSNMDNGESDDDGGTDENDNVDVLFIPGGNTFHLLHFLQTHPLLPQALRDFLEKGGVIFGGSAGALILGKDIAICDVQNGGLDENDIGLKDTAGLDLLGGAVVFPHFKTEEEEQHQVCKRWADEKDVVVIAMPERCGVKVDREKGMAWNTGPEGVWVFRPGEGGREYERGESWVL